MAKNNHGDSCCKFILTFGLIALFVWLSLRTSNPTFSIQDIYIPALNITNNSTTNHTIYFDLKLKNEMRDKGVHYANISLTFFYNSSLPVANYTVPAFYQGYQKKARRRQVVEAIGVPWVAGFDAVSNGSTVVIRVGLATRVKFKILFWYTKRHSLVVGGDVVVNGSGRKIGKKGIKLKSSAPEQRSFWVIKFVGPVIVSILLMI